MRPRSLYSRVYPCLITRQFHTKTKTVNRIGPHNLDVTSVLVGCLLGDAYAIKSNGTKFRIKQSVRHKDYLFFLYDFFYQRGYCSNSGPREYKTILINSSLSSGATKTEKTYYGYEFDIFTFSSLNWLYDLFYVNHKKVISPQIHLYLNPLSIAFLLMDDGCWVSGSKSVRIATNCFERQEVELLRDIFFTKFNLDCTIQLLTKKGVKNPNDKHSLYIKVASLPLLRELVLPYMHSSMLYKLGL